MPYELPKSQKKIARRIIEKGLKREYQNGIEKKQMQLLKYNTLLLNKLK